MNDDSFVKVMSTLGLNYEPAIQSTLRLQKHVTSLNQQLLQLKAVAMQGARGINTAFSSQMGQMAGGKTILDQYGQPLKVIREEAAKVPKAVKPAADSIKNLNKQYSLFGSEWNRRAGWFLSGTLFYGSLKAIGETVQTVSEVEMGVTQIQRVMSDSTFVFKEYRDELLQLGVEYGQTFETVQDIAMRWAQAGYNVVDSLELTKTSLLSLNAAEMDAQQATQGLIAIMSQWSLEATDLMGIIDKMNVTSDNYAITTQDIVEGLNRTGAAAKNMNLSIEETIGLITVLRESTGRVGKEVGKLVAPSRRNLVRKNALNSGEPQRWAIVSQAA